MSHHGRNPSHEIPAGNRANLSEVAAPALPTDPTRSAVDDVQQQQVNRPVASGPSHRGDRRDTHPSFSTGKGGRGSTAGKARNGGRSGPLGAAGRKSGPKSDA